MKFEKLTELIDERITGEWGQEPNSSGIKVIRTTNFTNEGRLDLSDVVQREIEEKKIEKKSLRKGDIIIEKSGGGPTQPVGRVVYFDIDSKEKYLCNNFTTILRPKASLVVSKYLLYQMLYLHKSGRTKRYQNKTTGIHNLNLEKYLQEKIALPPLPDQLHIANILSKAENLIAQRKESIRLLDEFLKSTFLEMFGDPVRNEKGWEVEQLGKVTFMKAGQFVAASDIQSEFSEGLYSCYGGNGLRGYVKTYTHEGDFVLIGRQGALCGNVKIAKGQFHATEHAVVCSPKMQFETYWLYYLLVIVNLNKYASGAAQPGLAVGRLEQIEIIFPPIELQTQFAQIVEKTEALKSQYQQSLQELENLYGSLSQKAFRGELSVASVK
jgi:type I restriction enzyme S subunit